MNEEILQMFAAVNKRIDEVVKQLSTPTVVAVNGTTENGQSILDVADLADENSTSIEELAEMLQDHEDRIAALEDKEA